MIGLGTWKCSINHSFYKGDAIITIRDNNGEYDFQAALEGNDKMPSYTVSNVSETGNRLEGELKIDILPMKIKFYADFDGDKASGGLMLPFVGEIKFENVIRIGD